MVQVRSGVPQMCSGINRSILLSHTPLCDGTQSKAGKEHMWQQTFSSPTMSEQPSSSFPVLPGQAWYAHSTCMPMKAQEAQVSRGWMTICPWARVLRCSRLQMPWGMCSICLEGQLTFPFSVFGEYDSKVDAKKQRLASRRNVLQVIKIRSSYIHYSVIIHALLRLEGGFLSKTDDHNRRIRVLVVVLKKAASANRSRITNVSYIWKRKMRSRKANSASFAWYKYLP